MGRESLTGPVTSYIAAELRAQRARHKWTFDEIAERTSVKRATVIRALKGDTAISVEVLIPLCGGMGVDVVALVREATEAVRAESKTRPDPCG